MILKMRAGVLGHAQYFKIASFPAVLGRASASDVWVPHAQVSASHARIEKREDGRVFIVDLGSANGLRKDHHLVSEIELKTGTHFDIGALKFDADFEESLDAHTEVLPKQADVLYLGITRAEWGRNFGYLLLQAFLVFVGSYYRSHDEHMMAYSLGRAAISIPLPLLLALGFALLSRLHAGEYRYWEFFRRSSAAFSLGWLVWMGTEVIAFNAPGFVGSSFVGAALFLAWVLYSGYSIARLVFTEQPARRVFRWILGIDVFLVSVMIVVSIVDKDPAFDFNGPYSVTLIDWPRPDTSQALAALDRDLASAAKKREEALKEEDAE